MRPLGTEGAEVWPATAAVAGQAGNGAVEAFEGLVDYTRGVEINHRRDRRLWSYADIRKFAMPARNVFLASHRARSISILTPSLCASCLATTRAS